MPSEKSYLYGLLTAGLCTSFALRTKATSKVAKRSQSLLAMEVAGKGSRRRS
jgi:hypothetical protein